mgnify:CR=1 FL=1
MEKELQENLLQAWVEMSVCIRGNRMLSQVSFNEIVICGILYRNALWKEAPLTATDLCERMKLLKSQINRLTTAMEEKGLICKRRSMEDKRKIYLELQEKGRGLYEQEHKRVMKILDAVTEALGEDGVEQLTGLVKETVAVVNRE